MTWRELRYELAAELDKVEPLLQAQRANTPAGKLQERAELIQLEGQCWPEIDVACRKYAETGTWPAIDSKKAILLCVRLAHAVLFLEFLAEAPETVSLLPLEGMQKTTALNFLLLGYWRFAGCSKWRTS